MAKVGDRLLDELVVRDLAQTRGLDEGEARARALDTLRLALAYAEEQGDGSTLDPARQRHLLRSAKARLYLRERYESSHTPQDVPDALIARELPRPIHFHPRLHFLCQIIVMPRQPTDGTVEFAPDDPDWHARASAELDRLRSHLQRYLPDPAQEDDCEYFMALTRFIETFPADDLQVRAESAAMDTCREDSWDPGFVAALCPRDEPGWVPPFETAFGHHLAAVVDIRPDTELPADQREAALRDKLLPGWRQSDFGDTMSKLRQEHTVRIHPQLRVDDLPPP